MALKDKLMTLEDFKAVRDVDVASNSAQFTEIKADLVDAYSSGSTPFVDMLDDTDTTHSGISYSLSGNTLSCDGTSTDTSQFVWFGTTSSKPPYWFVGGGKYIVSIDSTTESVDVRFQIKMTSNTSLQALAIYSQSGTYILDVPEDITVLRVVSIVSSGKTLNNDTLTLNIERLLNVESEISELRSGLGVLGIKNELTWNDGSYKTDGTISTNVQFGNRYSNIIDATTFNKLTITPFLGRQVCVAFFDRITGAFVSRSDYTTESVTIDNTYSVGINLATTYTDRTISTEDLLSLVEIYRSIPLSKWTGRKVAFVGDSITHGSYAPIPYHAVLNNMIGFSDMYVDGVAGSAYSVTATGNYTPISQRWQNIPTDRDLVVIFAGTNDWGHDAPIGTPADTTDVSMCGALSVVINGILTANPSARLVLITPLHRWGYTSGNYPNDTDNNGQGHPLSDYVDAIKDMAQAYSIPVIDLFSDSGLNPRIPAISTAFFQDGLHPINAGHARLARQIASELEVLNFSGSGIKANLEAKYSQLKADLTTKVDVDGYHQITPENIYGVQITGNLFDDAELSATNKYVNVSNGKLVYTALNGFNGYIIKAYPVKYSFTFARFALMLEDDKETAVGSLMQNTKLIDNTNGNAKYIAFSFNVSTYPVSSYVVSIGETLDPSDKAYELPDWMIYKDTKPKASRVSGNMGDGGSLIISDSTAVETTTNLRKGERIAYRADITSFSGVEVGLSYNTLLGNARINRVVVDDTNVNVYTIGDSVPPTITAHGLTIANNIQILLEVLATRQMKLTIISNGELFSQTYAWSRDAYGMPYALSDGSVLTGCELSWTCKDIDKDIWIFGDSYLQYNDARWTYYLHEYGYDDNVLLDGYAGQASGAGITAIRSLLNYGTPKYAIWILGMNDGTDTDDSTPNSTWATKRDSFLSLCSDNNVTPVFGTIPTVPSINNNGKNSWIRSSGYRYIDFAKAVGADSSGNWYSGMIASDNVHPTEQGAKALYGRVLTDFPEIMVNN